MAPIAGGLLRGKYRRDQQSAEGRQLGDWQEPPVRNPEKLWNTVDLLVQIAVGHRVSPTQVAANDRCGTPDLALHGPRLVDGSSYSAAERCLSVEGLALADTGVQTAVVLLGGGCVAWDDGMKVFPRFG